MKRFTFMIMSLLLTCAGTTGVRAQEALIHVTEAPRNGIYVIHSASSSANGYLYNESGVTNRPFRVTDATDLSQTGVSAAELKFCWMLTRSDDGQTFTLQNLSSLNHVPADVQRNTNMTGTETADLAIEAATDATDGDWYMYQTNYKNGENTLYVHTNKAGGMDGNLSYWDGKNATGTSVRLTFYSLPDAQETAIIDAAADVLAAQPVNCVGGIQLATLEKLQAEKTVDNLQVCLNARIELVPDGLYRIVNVSPKDNTAGTTNHTAMTVSTEGTPVTAIPSQADVNAVWKFEAIGTAGQYKLKNMNAQKYITPISTGDYRASLVDADAAGTMEVLGLGEAQYRIHSVGSSDNCCLFCENNVDEGYTISGWNKGKNSASAWYIIPAKNLEIPLNNAGGATWASAYLPFGVKAGEGTDVALYTAAVNAEDDTVLDLTPAADGVKAENGFILKGTDTIATLDIVAGAEGAESELGGTLTAVDDVDSSEYYVLSNGSAGVGFYHPKGTALAANKAFLQRQVQGVGALRFSFGDVTGIGNAGIPATPVDNGVCYDLSGRRVSVPTKGIYVKNGKKFIVR